MIRDKRHFEEKNEINLHKFDKVDRIQRIVLKLLVETSQQVNQLITAQDIDVSLYVQDEMDR